MNQRTDMSCWAASAAMVVSGSRVPPRKDGVLGREIPDVSAVAGPKTGYQAFVDGRWTVLGGTAAATPLWGGLVALLN
jgi:kumamolisin